ncbi:MAG: choice-of-anchor I family protein [Actinobacteria bacterium]|nr:choice-of-anchor I family protein [Actinomycetota bacterium]
MGTRRHRVRLAAGLGALAIGTALITIGSVANAVPPLAAGGLQLVPVGTYNGGGLARAEIVAFDAASKRMFINNGSQNRVDIVSIENPTTPSLVSSFDVSSYNGYTNSVTAANGVVAVAIDVTATVASNGRKTANPGKVVLIDTNGTLIRALDVGVQPDHVSFSPDKKKILVAGEGEPLCANDDPATVGTDESTDPALVTDPNGTISIIDLSSGAANATTTTLDFANFDKTALLAEGVRVFFPGSSAAKDLEPEYVAVSPDNTKAFVTLQEANAMAIVDLTTSTIVDVVSLGYKNWGANTGNLLIDASDKDNGSGGAARNMTSYAGVPLKGMYMPDSIASFARNGQTYTVTANEGDSRDWPCYKEESRFNDTSGADSFASFWVGSTIDTSGTTGNTGTSIKSDNRLGRIKTTMAFPTTTPLTDMYVFGARSFTIWNSSGTKVWDSGSQFEEIMQRDFPNCFNSDASDSAASAALMAASICSTTTVRMDGRSDDKGVEPEAITTGVIGAQTFAFIGLERVGGVMVYDVSNPTNPQFVTYKNPAIDGSSGAGATDVSPEGFVFVPAAQSPNGTPLLLVANELSGTTTIYEVRVPSPLAPSADAPATATIDAFAESSIASSNSLTRGGTVSATYTGFTPYETVHLVLESTPTVLATGTASATGSITLSANVPGDAAVGNHRLSLYAPVSGIGVRTAVTIAEAPSSTPGSPGTPPVNPPTLPATGAKTDTSVLGLSLLAMGCALLVVRRRRPA